MAALTVISSLFSNVIVHSSSSSNKHFPTAHLNFNSLVKFSFKQPLTLKKKNLTLVCSLDEEETAVLDVQPPPQEGVEEAQQQTVSVPVSASDKLTMYFQAEGSMSEAAIPTINKKLEEMEGVTDLRVQIVEGIASVELAKQTTVQATGVASGLVEAIQGSGFKLQTLNLSFQDEEDAFA